jgi:hypothetical protein
MSIRQSPFFDNVWISSSYMQNPIKLQVGYNAASHPHPRIKYGASSALPHKGGGDGSLSDKEAPLFRAGTFTYSFFI